MTRFVSGVTGLIGAAALVVAGSAIDVHAQRGNAGGHGRPATAGTQAQGHGRPATPGAQGQAHKPDTTDHTTHAKGTSGSPGASAASGGASDQLARNTHLSAKLQPLFPAGTDLQKESAGFRNLGQFVAAAHVSNNLDIPWTDLKAKMTGEKPVSLGQAIQELKPGVNAQAEADKAQTQADADVNTK